MNPPALDLAFSAPDAAPAVSCEGQHLSYGQLRQRAGSIVARLQAEGLRAGDRFGFMLVNGPNVLACYMACAHTGIVGVPLSQRLTAAELEFQIVDSEAVVVMCSPGFAALTATVAGRLPVVRCWFSEADLPMSGPRLSQPPSLEAPAPGDAFCIMYTGGTTGSPKAAVQTRQGWACCLQATVDAWQATAADRHLMSLPMSHAAWFSAGATLCAGGHVTILRAWDPALALEVMARERITTLNMIPTMLGDLVKAHDLQPRRIDSVRLLTVAGSLLPAAIRERACAFLGPVVGNIYGLTEAAGPVTFLLPADMHGARRESVGRANPFIDLVVLDENGRPTDGIAPGEIGLAGPQITPGYWRRPDETRESFAGRWLKTGDIARVDAEGFVHLVDRKKDMIKSGGYNIYPSEIEQVIYGHPAVLECAVLGAPDERWIEAVHAVVVLRTGQQCTVQDIMAVCREGLAAYKVPKAVHLVAQIPRTRFGKFDRVAALRLVA